MELVMNFVDVGRVLQKYSTNEVNLNGRHKCARNLASSNRAEQIVRWFDAFIITVQ